MINNNVAYIKTNIGPDPVNQYFEVDSIPRMKFFEAEKQTDKNHEQYNSAIEKRSVRKSRNLEEIRKNPRASLNSLKLSDSEKNILHKIAEINGVSRQTSEFFYRLSLATRGVNNLIEFVDSITGTEPGYYNKGIFTVGLTRLDRAGLFSVKV